MSPWGCSPSIFRKKIGFQNGLISKLDVLSQLMKLANKTLDSLGEMHIIGTSLSDNDSEKVEKKGETEIG
jgi:ethanolamine utilization protein EutP (predicted NTPase)